MPGGALWSVMVLVPLTSNQPIHPVLGGTLGPILPLVPLNSINKPTNWPWLCMDSHSVLGGPWPVLALTPLNSISSIGKERKVGNKDHGEWKIPFSPPPPNRMKVPLKVTTFFFNKTHLIMFHESHNGYNEPITDGEYISLPLQS